MVMHKFFEFTAKFVHNQNSLLIPKSKQFTTFCYNENLVK